MQSQKLITALLLMLPATVWAAPQIPEPEVLPLLAIGGVADLSVKVMRRKK